MEHNKLIERFAEVQGITYEEAAELINGENDEEIMDNIMNFTKSLISARIAKFNRKERRALRKKLGKQHMTEAELISETATKLNYIDLIQKLKNLNEEKEKENNNYDTAN